jgi:CheY-like chemotaxis protein
MAANGSARHPLEYVSCNIRAARLHSGGTATSYSFVMVRVLRGARLRRRFILETNSADKKGCVVLVEPDDLIRELLDSWLSEAGYCVAVYTSAKLTENRVRDPAPLLIVADVPDPGDAAKVIHSLREAYPSPILILSARFRRGLGTSMHVAQRLGVRRVLPKPFTRAELLGAVRESIE